MIHSPLETALVMSQKDQGAVYRFIMEFSPRTISILQEENILPTVESLVLRFQSLPDFGITMDEDSNVAKIDFAKRRRYLRESNRIKADVGFLTPEDQKLFFKRIDEYLRTFES